MYDQLIKALWLETLVKTSTKICLCSTSQSTASTQQWTYDKIKNKHSFHPPRPRSNIQHNAADTHFFWRWILSTSFSIDVGTPWIWTSCCFKFSCSSIFASSSFASWAFCLSFESRSSCAKISKRLMRGIKKLWASARNVKTNTMQT